MKNRYFYFNLLITLFLLFTMGFCFALPDVNDDDYSQGKEAGYSAGLKAGTLPSIDSDTNNNVLLCQIEAPPPSYIPQKSEEFVRGYKDGWDEGYKKGYEKGSGEGNEGYLLGFILGLIGVVFSYLM